MLIFVQLQRFFYYYFAFKNLTQRQKRNALHVFAHIMHTWSPGYNQTLPSIYQIVNGLIHSYVDTIYIYTHTHLLDMHTCMFVQCTQSTALCYFCGWFSLQMINQPKWWSWTSLQFCLWCNNILSSLSDHINLLEYEKAHRVMID